MKLLFQSSSPGLRMLVEAASGGVVIDPTAAICEVSKPASCRDASRSGTGFVRVVTTSTSHPAVASSLRKAAAKFSLIDATTTSEKTIRLNIAMVMPVRPLFAVGYEVASLIAGTQPEARPPSLVTPETIQEKFWMITSVDAATMQMPETKNISMLPLYSPKMAENTSSGS